MVGVLGSLVLVTLTELDETEVMEEGGFAKRDGCAGALVIEEGEDRCVATQSGSSR